MKRALLACFEENSVIRKHDLLRADVLFTALLKSTSQAESHSRRVLALLVQNTVECIQGVSYDDLSCHFDTGFLLLRFNITLRIIDMISSNHLTKEVAHSLELSKIWGH